MLNVNTDTIIKTAQIHARCMNVKIVIIHIMEQIQKIALNQINFQIV